MTRKSHRCDLRVVFVAGVMLGACEREDTRPPDERIDAPEADQDSDGGDGVQGAQDNPGPRIDENEGAPEDE